MTKTIDDRLRMEASILTEASEIVNGSRDDQYGSPVDAFKVYAEILDTTFNIELSPADICRVLMAVKLGRLRYKYKRDSLVDLCGYAEILSELLINRSYDGDGL
jgi:hypothetical protein